MVQIFAYFEYVQSVWKLEPTNILLDTRTYSLQWFSMVSEASLALQTRIIASIEKEVRAMNRKVRISPTCVAEGVAWRTWKIRKFELRNLILAENSKLYENMHQQKFPAIRYFGGKHDGEETEQKTNEIEIFTIGFLDLEKG